MKKGRRVIRSPASIRYVARMERSEIRGPASPGEVSPDYASLHPGYERNQNEQVPLRSRPSLKTSASPKVGTSEPTITV
jgi:hypothetical protein